jgi:hypothetical protein
MRYLNFLQTCKALYQFSKVQRRPPLRIEDGMVGD